MRFCLPLLLLVLAACGSNSTPGRRPIGSVPGVTPPPPASNGSGTTVAPPPVAGVGHPTFGEITSSGGEYITAEQNPWFLGTAPVAYCIQHGENFSLPLGRAQALVKAAFADWTKTLRELRPTPVPGAFADGEKKNLSFEFREVSCAEPHPLTITLGDKPPMVEQALAHHAKFTLSLAVREALDESTGRTGNGILWLAPDRGDDRYSAGAGGDFWLNENLFNYVLLHEAGHLFGFTHDMGAGTFMAAAAPAQAVRQASVAPVSSHVFVDRSWYALGGSVCGTLQPKWEEWPKLVSLTIDSALQGCLTVQPGSGETRQVKLVAKNGASTKTALLTYPNAFHTPIGQAIAPPLPLSGEYHGVSHDFFSLSATLSLKGKLKIGDAERAADLEQDAQGKITLVIYSAEPDRPFGMIDLIPGPTPGINRN